MHQVFRSASVDPTAELPVLLEKFERCRALVGIVGLGYVGIPLALSAVKAGFTVLGFDIDQERTERINRGEVIMSHIGGSAIADAVDDGRFEATADFGRMAEPDAIIICVPTPLTRYREPDLSFVVETSKAIAKSLRSGQLVVLESTTYPGTTRGVVRPILESSGLKSETDFFLAYSPEREDPGNPEFGASSTPKVIGGDGPQALALAKALYGHLALETVPVTSPDTAEAVKLTENIFRSVNIALVNELKLIYGQMGIDVWEVIEAAKTKPFGFMPFYPGPGLGGHCIPIDPFYLTWKAREYGISTRFVELAGEINTAMPNHVVNVLGMALDKRWGRGFKDARVLILGLAYKKNVEDIRESPSLRLMELIEDRGAAVDYHDPLVSTLPITRDHADLAGRDSILINPATIADYDAVLIATDHDDVDYAMVVGHAKLVLDTRNACAKRGLVSQNVVKA